MNYQTKAIHNQGKTLYGETQTPIHMSAGFSYDTAEELEAVFNHREFGYMYSRISNPTVVAFEQRLASVEEAVGAVAFASGMAGIASVVYALCESGDNVAVASSLFGGTYDLFVETLAKGGVEARFYDPMDVDALKATLDDKTRFVFVESLGNPKMDTPDIKVLADIAHAHKLPLVVDHTMVGSYLQPIKDLGADVVVYSTTKYITGHGTGLGGAVVDLGNFSWKQVKPGFIFLAEIRRHGLHNVGASLSPFNAYLAMLGLETVALRMDRHQANATAVSQFLEGHASVSSVTYPGISGMLRFELASKAACFAFINATKIAKNIPNLGDSKTLIIHPKSTIFSNQPDDVCLAAGVTDQTIRCSVGLEHSDDIIRDFKEALTHVN